MSIPAERAPAEEPPGWALDKALDELYEEEDRSVILDRAWELVREAEERESERHDEYDDPDQGGEA
jgi:hypothetical protein